jgi:hypothetical protein
MKRSMQLFALLVGILLIGFTVTTLASATPSSGSTTAKASAGASLLTPKSVKCLGSVWDQKSYARCKPQLTLAAVQKFATIAAPRYLPRSWSATQDLGGEAGTYTQTFLSEFVSVSACHRGFPRSFESGCSLMTRDTYTYSSKADSGSTCSIESLVALGTEILPSTRGLGFDDSVAVFRIKKPFAVRVAPVGPNPDPPPTLPC